jgi:hypothetical protein
MKMVGSTRRPYADSGSARQSVTSFSVSESCSPPVLSRAAEFLPGDNLLPPLKGEQFPTYQYNEKLSSFIFSLAPEVLGIRPA